MIKADWLWDRKTTPEEAQAILKDEGHGRFIEMAALLLSRKNTPQEVFADYLGKESFVKNWARIKKQMRKNTWNDPRIIFWQAIYEKLLETFRAKGMVFRQKKIESADSFCREVGDLIRQKRVAHNLTQGELAHQLGISQQIISQVEKGRHNTGILTIKRIAQVLGEEVEIVIK